MNQNGIGACFFICQRTLDCLSLTQTSDQRLRPGNHHKILVAVHTQIVALGHFVDSPPKTDLSVGYRKVNASAILKLFLSRLVKLARTYPRPKLHA
jgi:hypothetical protein